MMHPEYQNSKTDKSAAKQSPVRPPAPAKTPSKASVGRTGDVIQRARQDPQSLTPTDVLQMQALIGNRATVQLMKGPDKTPKSSAGDSESSTPQFSDLPENIKRLLKELSAISLDDLRVQRNSSGDLHSQVNGGFIEVDEYRELSLAPYTSSPSLSLANLQRHFEDLTLRLDSLLSTLVWLYSRIRDEDAR